MRTSVAVLKLPLYATCRHDQFDTSFDSVTAPILFAVGPFFKHASCLLGISWKFKGSERWLHSCHDRSSAVEDTYCDPKWLPEFVKPPWTGLDCVIFDHSGARLGLQTVQHHLKTWNCQENIKVSHSEHTVKFFSELIQLQHSLIITLLHHKDMFHSLKIPAKARKIKKLSSFLLLKLLCIWTPWRGDLCWRVYMWDHEFGPAQTFESSCYIDRCYDAICF